MSQVVLDASALLALLLGEPGAERIRPVLAVSAICAVNFAEVIGYFCRNGVAVADIRRVLDPLPAVRVPFDESLAYEAGLLLPVTRPYGLSFGDRACLALARRLDIPALTADRSWQKAGAAAGLRVDCIR